MCVSRVISLLFLCTYVILSLSPAIKEDFRHIYLISSNWRFLLVGILGNYSDWFLLYKAFDFYVSIITTIITILVFTEQSLHILDRHYPIHHRFTGLI
jgi:hypothetical protein